LEDRRQHADVERAGIERAADGGAVEHRPLVQQMHGVAQQDLGLEVGLAVGRQHVVQIERQRRVGQPLAADSAARRQIDVAPGPIGRHPIEKEIETRRIAGVLEINGVGGDGAHRDAGAHRGAGFH
jgi:hypothetical protein